MDTGNLATPGHLKYVRTERTPRRAVLRRAQPRRTLVEKPAKFLEVVIHDLDPTPGLTGLDAGYEGGEWRARQLAAHLFHWLPEFALSYSEYSGLNAADAVEKIQRAARVIYNTDKYSRRGEFGELLLHIAIRQTFDTVPAISKIYFKDSANDTVKGFDAVHVAASGQNFELWLGEAKFYDDAKKAVASVIEESQDHLQPEFLRREFLAITNKVDPTWPFADKLKALLHENTSLDKVFASICVPVLLTYDSSTLAAHKSRTQEFLQALEVELREHHAHFCESLGQAKVRVHLFLLPLNTKKVLVEALNEKLTAWHKI